MISAQSSGSSRSAAAVEPFTSQNSMVTTRRSPAMLWPARAASSLASSSWGMYCSNLSRVSVAGAAVFGSPFSACPQLPQNLACGGFSAAQFGHTRVMAWPHCMQKRALSGFWAEQCGQFTPDSRGSPLQLPDLWLCQKGAPEALVRDGIGDG